MAKGAPRVAPRCYMLLEFYEKRKLKRIVYTRAAVVLLLMPTLLLAYATYNAFLKERQTAQRREAIAAELGALEKREQALQEEIERLSTDRGIEEEIRSKFDVGRKGEKLIVIVEPEQEAEAQAEFKEKEDGWLDSFFSLFD